MLEELTGSSISSFLIKGNPGTGKSSLALELLRREGRGTYVSTRVSKEKIPFQNPQVKLVQMGGTGKFSIGGAAIDAEDFRLSNARRVIDLVLEKIQNEPGTLIILDSWDSIAKEMDIKERLKTEKMLVASVESSDSKLGFVSEDPHESTTDYLVDAIIELKSTIHLGRIRRTLEIMKFRGSQIQTPISLFTLDTGRFCVCPRTVVMFPGQYQAKPFNPIVDPPGRYSSGVEDLDKALGGGFVPGSAIALEYGKGVGSVSLLPFDQTIMANFLANGSACVAIPSSGIPPEMFLGPLRLMLSKEVIEKRVRVGYYEKYDDPCSFQLNSESVDETFNSIRNAIEEMKAGGAKSSYVSIWVERLEYVHGSEKIPKNLVMLTTWLKHNRDLFIMVVNDTSTIRNTVAAISDAHVLFETTSNTLTSQGIKPEDSILAIRYDYSRGYARPSFAVIS